MIIKDFNFDDDQFISRKEYREQNSGHESDKPLIDREQYKSDDKKNKELIKSERLKKRLDKLIFILVILIVITYLILFFLN